MNLLLIQVEQDLHRGGNGLSVAYRFLVDGHIGIHDDRWLTYPWGGKWR
jgi:N-methylhydantoinase B/oxoprolinase/acetone carboxylase alpha subunit